MSNTGNRIVMERRLTDTLLATLDYSTGGVATLRAPVARWQDVASSVISERRHALGAKFAGTLPACHTHFIASYKWTSGSALSSVDEFNASPGQMDPYFSIFMRQPL